MFSSDPNRPTEEILQDLHHGAQQHRNPGIVFISFSALLQKLSKQSIQSSSDLKSSVDGLKAHLTLLDEKNGKLQRAVTALTVVSVVLALLQVVLAALPYVYPVPVSAAQSEDPRSASSGSVSESPKEKLHSTPALPTIPEHKLDQHPPAATSRS